MSNFSAEESTISPFLSSNNVSQYFVPQGPVFTTDTVQDISLILKRERPSEEDILEGCRTVESRDDNLWPLNGEHDHEVVQSRWNEGNEAASTSYKRRRMENSTMSDELVDIRGGRYLAHLSVEPLIGTTTTMQNNSTFSNPCSSGFVSAATQLHHSKEIQKRNIPAERKKAASRSIDRSQHRDVNVGMSKTIKKHVGQGSLLSFWPAKTEIKHLHGQTSTSPQDLPVYEDGASKMNEKQESEEIEARMADVATMSAELGTAHKANPSAINIPQGLADHQLRSSAESSRLNVRPTECKEKTKRYVFLSSSPPHCEYLQKENMDTTSKDIPPSIDSESTLKSTSSDIHDLRPASTFHHTSLARVHATSNLPKKTLGVRRSMEGWSSRGGQGFTVPSRATPTFCNPPAGKSDVKG